MLQSNATLTQVASQGADSYDAPAEGGTKWSGTVAAYLERKNVRVNTGAGSEIQRQWTVYLPASLIVDWQIGDVLTLTVAPRGYMPSAATYNVPVQSIAVNDEPDMPDDVCVVALVVEPASA